MITALEDALLARLRAAFGATLQAIDHRPAALDEPQLHKLITKAPAAYVGFLGFAATELTDASVDCQFGVYLVARHVTDEPSRRRGDGRTLIGLYDMARIATASLREHVLADEAGEPVALGPIRIVRLDPLPADVFAKHGLAVHGLVVSVPAELTLGELPSLDDFETFHADWDVPPLGNVQPPLPAGTADARQTIALETA
jgi:phage gp37-like protein